MSDTTASLRRKIGSAGDLQSVVRTMKAMAASSIGQYEKSVRALGRLLSDRGAGAGRLLSRERAGGPISGAKGANRCAVRSARSCSAPTRDWSASSTTWWPIMRSRPSRPCPAKPRSGRSASAFMRAWRTPACRWPGSSPCRIPSRPSRRSSGRFRSKAKRIGPEARSRAL